MDLTNVGQVPGVESLDALALVEVTEDVGVGEVLESGLGEVLDAVGVHLVVGAWARTRCQGKS